MFNIDLQRSAAAAVAALLFTTAFVGAAVAPARVAETGGAMELAQDGVASVRHKAA
ncbi:MAG: hypothetical protein M3Q08_04060 [Pseudomonadota bacterium]|nr:hypothetical protein [Pseudomonadota bacterium]